MERRVIISRLIDKYENSKHLLEPKASTRRVMLRIDKNELPEYRYDEGSDIRDAYNNAAKALENDGIVSIEWARSNRLSLIALNLNALGEAYSLCGRQHPREKAESVISALENGLDGASCEWINRWKRKTCETARSTYKLPHYCKDSMELLEKLITAFKMYDSLNGASISMRAFSIKCYKNSKTFERECCDQFLKIAGKYNAELSELCQQPDIGSREELAFLGIYTRPEIYELSGGCKVRTSDGIIDIAAAGRFGIGIPSTMVDSVIIFDLSGISKITFIENKTSYDEYLITEKKPNELILFHGGFLSPQKKKLYKKLSDSIHGNIKVVFWADIDLGGFRMFEKLNEIFPQLVPMRMGADDVIKFHDFSKSNHGKDYYVQLKKYFDENMYPQFSGAIEQILKYQVTIEQEIFLLE